MGLKVKALHLGDALGDWSFLLFNFKPGRKTCTPINSFLILGAESPILIDTGIRDLKLLEPFGIEGFETPEQDIVKLLREEGLAPPDIGYIIHMHLVFCPGNKLTKFFYLVEYRISGSRPNKRLRI